MIPAVYHQVVQNNRATLKIIIISIQTFKQTILGAWYLLRIISEILTLEHYKSILAGKLKGELKKLFVSTQDFAQRSVVIRTSVGVKRSDT